MRFLNFGSLNVDYTYQVRSIAHPGETISSTGLRVSGGGKGLNQSLALARAGAQTCHAGAIAQADAGLLKDILDRSGVDTRYVRTDLAHSGQAIIQVDQAGQNCIVLFGGANREITTADVDRVLENFGPGDALVLQNEVSCVAYLIRRGRERGMTICFNPSPADELLEQVDLALVDTLLLNEIEGGLLTGLNGETEIAAALLERYPQMKVVLTLGEQGVYYADADQTLRQAIFPVKATDTTGAGDTFTGFYLASLYANGDIAAALRRASAASALAVSREGAADSIPTLNEVIAFLSQHP